MHRLGGRASTGLVGVSLVGMAALAISGSTLGWDHPGAWVPDVLVCWVFLVCALIAFRRGFSGSAGLLFAVGVTWALGFSDVSPYWHRGPLVNLILAYPSWRPRSRSAAVVVVLGYAAAVIGPAWDHPAAAIAMSVLLVGVATSEWVRSRAPERRTAAFALVGSVVVGTAFAMGALSALLRPEGDWSDLVELTYAGALMVTGVLLTSGLRLPARTALADVVVELGVDRSGTLTRRMAKVVGDPELQVGYWSPDLGGYVDESGQEIAVPTTGRQMTYVDRGGQPFAAVVHAEHVVDKQALRNAVRAASGYVESNRALQAEVSGQLAELRASRRRVIVAADQERRRLAEALHAGPDRQLAALEEALSADILSGVEDEVRRARDQVTRTRADLAQAGQGLPPRELLVHDLATALRSLAAGSPIPVVCHVETLMLSPEVETAAFFVCAEAIANATKHSNASRIEVSVVRRGRQLDLTVSDDGRGGADPAGGTGLCGLSDRVEGLGGEFAVGDRSQGGTALVATLPLA